MRRDGILRCVAALGVALIGCAAAATARAQEDRLLLPGVTRVVD